MDLQCLETADLSALEKLVPTIEGELAISAIQRGDTRIYQVWFFADDRDHHGSAETLARAIAKAFRGHIPRKKCSRCLRSKPLADFGVNSSGHKDGRASHCLECDRKRKRKWYPRSSRPRPLKGGAPGAPAPSEEPQNPRGS